MSVLICFDADNVTGEKTINIFQYKNRRRQIRLTNWGVALVVVWYIAYVAVSTILAGELSLGFLSPTFVVTTRCGSDGFPVSGSCSTGAEPSRRVPSSVRTYALSRPDTLMPVGFCALSGFIVQ